MARRGTYAFMGSKEAGLLALERLVDLAGAQGCRGVVCPDDSSDARSVLPRFQEFARERGLPLEVAPTAARAKETLAAWRPGAVFVVGWYHLLDVDAFPATGFYGFHYSLLPAYRGAAPLVWALLRGEPRAGVSFFRFSSGMDEGDLVGQAAFEVGPDENIADALAKAQQAMLRLMDGHVPALLAGEAKLHPQAREGASYCAFRVPEDGLIDWTWPARRVHDFVRAQTRPYPGAFTRLPDGRTLRVWKTRVDPRPWHGAPGAVAERRGESVVVACGEGALEILEAEADGEGPAPPARLMASLKVRLR